MVTTAAIYARVSSARQKEEQTIASQTAALRAHAAAAGWEVPPEWVFEDEGYSGATLIRPGLERLRDLAAEIEIPVVLCYAPDRLARRYAYQALLIEEFARVGSEVRFLKAPKAETPEDELLLQFQGMIAEYERAQIIERTRRGKLHRARSGSPAVLSGAPYGYRYVRKSEEAEARYDIVEREAVVVRELFRRYVEENESIAGLSRWLGEQGIPTATGKSRWDRSTIWGMLRNPAYCGHAAFGKTRQVGARPKMTRPVRRQGKRVVPSGHVTRDQPRSEWIEIAVPPIVSEQVFELASRRLQDNRRFAPRRTKEPSLLQGLVACASCGYSYYRCSTRTRKRRLYYYRCLGSDDYRYEQGRVCSSRPVRQDYLEDLVWGHVMKLLADPGLIRAEIDRRLRDLRAANPTTAQKVQAEARTQPLYASEDPIGGSLPRGAGVARRATRPHARPSQEGVHASRTARRTRGRNPRPGDVPRAGGESRKVPWSPPGQRRNLFDRGATASRTLARERGARRPRTNRDPALNSHPEPRFRRKLPFVWEEPSHRLEERLGFPRI